MRDRPMKKIHGSLYHDGNILIYKAPKLKHKTYVLALFTRSRAYKLKLDHRK